jgi:tetratricopeptide (TPR) repeat protein
VKNSWLLTLLLSLGTALLLNLAVKNVVFAWNYAPQVNRKLTEATELYHNRNFSSAKIVFNEALQLEPSCPDAYNGLGLCFQNQGDLEAAADCYKNALKVKPDFYNSIYNLANNYYLQRQYSESIPYYLRAMKLKGKDNPELLVSLGNVYRERAAVPNSPNRDADLSKALQSYQKAINIKPDLSQAHAMLGQLHLEQKRFQLAEKELLAAIAYNDKYSYAYYILGKLYFTKKEFPAALVAYHNSLKHESIDRYKEDTLGEMGKLGMPSETAEHFARGYEAMNTRKWDEAEVEFDPVAQSEGPFRAVALNNLGYAQWRQKNLAEAIKSYKKAIQIMPHGQPEFYYNLGQAYLTKFVEPSANTKNADLKSALADAEKSFKQCITEARGNHFLAHNALGIVLKLKGEKNEALNEYNLAVMQSAGHLAVVQFNRALLLEELGRKDEAKKSYETYLRLAPTGANAESSRQRVARL